MTTSDPGERALFDAILVGPDDDDCRLVYADWLEERGDPRAEWLRLERDFHRESRPMTEAARLRFLDLSVELDPDWVGLLCRPAVPGAIEDTLIEIEEICEEVGTNFGVELSLWREPVVTCPSASEAVDRAIRPLRVNGGLRPIEPDTVLRTVGNCLGAAGTPGPVRASTEFRSARRRLLDYVEARTRDAVAASEFTPRGRGWTPIYWAFGFVVECPTFHLVLTGQSLD